jgi:hypothetical protein
MMYRLLRPLAFGERIVPAGAVKRLGLDEKDIATLLDRGAIAPIAMPPLSEIPLWKPRANKLLKVGILDAGQFLEATSKMLAEYLDVEPSTIEEWKGELLRWLAPAKEDEGCHC